MKRVFELETTSFDEKALAHAHTSATLDFAFNSILQTIVNSAREQLVKDEREAARLEGRSAIGTADEVIAQSALPNADAREASHFAKLAEEQAEREAVAKRGPLTARQLRLGLVNNGFSLGQVDTAIDALPDGADKEKARIEWQYAGEFNRDHPLIATIAVRLGISAELFETMWTEALKL